MAFMMSDKNTVLLIMLVVEIVSLPFFWAWLYGGGFSAWYERHLTKRAPDRLWRGWAWRLSPAIITFCRCAVRYNRRQVTQDR